MNITKVTVKKIEGQQTLRGVASVVLDDEIKIRDIKILERGDNGLSIMMPNKKVADGKSTKIIIPSEIQNMAGLLTSAKELLSDK